MDAKTFGARLKELRAAAGLSQQALADKAGLSQRGIANWELGLREPLWSNVLALADALGVDVAAFREEPKKIPEPKRGRPRKDTGEPQGEPERPPGGRKKGRSEHGN